MCDIIVTLPLYMSHILTHKGISGDEVKKQTSCI